MSALERRGSYVAASGRERRCEAARELVELHLIDTVGALIASTRTVEGLGLLRFRAAMRARGHADGAWALDLATRCALAIKPPTVSIRWSSTSSRASQRRSRPLAAT